MLQEALYNFFLTVRRSEILLFFANNILIVKYLYVCCNYFCLLSYKL